MALKKAIEESHSTLPTGPPGFPALVPTEETSNLRISSSRVGTRNVQTFSIP